MAITFPRNIPDEVKWVGLTFLRAPMAELSPLRSGKIISVDVGPELWRARWESGPLDETNAGIARAWVDTLMNVNAFYGYDRIREYPLNYPNGFTGLLVGGNPWGGTALMTAVASNKVEVTLSQLPAGFKLARGDYLSFDYATPASRALHRVVADATATGGGAISALEVRPYIRPGWNSYSPPVATVSFYRASAKMLILPGSYAETEVAPNLLNFSFEAIQTL